MFILPEIVNTVLEELNAAGFEAYLVGGCVRDHYLGKTPQDYDITTNALPHQVKQVFLRYPVLETGLRHGTVTVLTESLPLEVTTYRADGQYSDGRHPDSVCFSQNLTEDLMRRDFTINAMAYHPAAGLIDPFGGQRDLQQRQIKAVGEARQRFSEDSLRILRALRFASCLGFSLERETEQAALTEKERLQKVSAERFCAELIKLLCGCQVKRVLLDYPEILGVWLPELLPMVGFDQKNCHHIYSVWEHTAVTTASIPPEPALRLSALLHDIGKPNTFSLDSQGTGHFYGHCQESLRIAQRILPRLRLDKKTSDRILTLIRYHDTPLKNEPRLIKRRLNRLGADCFFDLILLQKADNMGQSPEYRSRQQQLDHIQTVAIEIMNAQDCFSLKNLAVSGEDLIRLGYRPGPAIGRMLNQLLEMVIDGRLPNEKSLLLKQAQEKKQS